MLPSSTALSRQKLYLQIYQNAMFELFLFCFDDIWQAHSRFNVTQKTNKRLPAIYTKYLKQDY